MGGFNLVSQGATSAVDPSKAAAMKRKQLRDVMRNNQREWTEAKVRQGKYLEPAFYKKVIKEKGPIKLLHSNIKIEPRPALFPKHLDFNMLKISTLNLPANKRLFGFDPVDLVGGGYVFNRREPLFPSGAPIEWAWNWNSQSEYAGSLGNKIQFSFDAHLIYSKEDMRFCYNDLEGRKMLVPYLEMGKTYYHEPFYLRFERSEDGWLIYHLETQVYCFFKERQTPDVYRLTKAWKGTEEYTFDYDSEDRLSQISDNNQHQWEISYNDRGLIQQVAREGSRLVSYEYDSLGNLTKVTNQAGHSMDFYYQEYLLTRRKDECGYSFFWQYDKEDRVIRTWGEGHVLEGSLTYNDEELYTLTTDGLGSETQYFYNNQGIVTQIDYGDDTSEFFEYDKEERLIRKQHRDRTETTYKYNELGLLTEEHHSNGAFLLIEYDKLGRWIKKETPESNLSCCYESFGAVKEIKKDGEILESYQYDEESHLPIKSHKNGTDYIYQYDTKNQSVIVKTQDGTKLWKYNDVNRLIQYEDGNEIYQFVYTKMGQLAQVTKNGEEISNSIYDAKGRVIVSTIEGQRTEWVYDGLDHVVKENDGIGELTYSYNKNGQISQIKLNRESLLTLRRNSHGQIIEQEIAGLPKLFYNYDDDGRVNEIFDETNHTKYRYDEKGYIFEKIVNEQFWEMYDFDSQGRMIAAENLASKINLQYVGNQLAEETMVIKNPDSEEELQSSYIYKKNGEREVKLNDEIIHSKKCLEEYDYYEYVLLNNMILQYICPADLDEEIIRITDVLDLIIEGTNVSVTSKKTNEEFLLQEVKCKEMSEIISRVEKIKEKLAINDISTEIKTGFRAYSSGGTIQKNEENPVMYDALGRVILSLENKSDKQFVWSDQEVLYMEEMEKETENHVYHQFLKLGNHTVIATFTEDDESSLIIDNETFPKKILLDMDQGEIVLEKKNRRKEEFPSVSVDKKSKEELWRADVNAQISMLQRDQLVLNTSILVYQAIDKKIEETLGVTDDRRNKRKGGWMNGGES